METWIIVVILVVLVLVPLIVFFVLYNKLARSRNQIENAISSTDSLFIKRSDLIPNLITVAQKYADFEKDTLEKITALRGMNSRTSPEQEKQAQQALQNFKLQVENYPDLKTNQQYMNLQYNMSEVEEQISAGRRYISSSITFYNDLVTTLPSNIIATMTGFKKYEWQYATEQQRQSVDAKALFNNKSEN